MLGIIVYRIMKMYTAKICPTNLYPKTFIKNILHQGNHSFVYLIFKIDKWLFRTSIVFLLIISNIGLVGAQIPNIDSISKTFIDIEDIDTNFYLELDSFKKSIKTYVVKVGYDKILVDSKQRWAKLYLDKNPMHSLNEFEESIDIAEKIGYLNGIAFGKHEMGILFFKKGLYENAIHYLFESSNLHEKNKNWWIYGFSLIDIGNVYFKVKQFSVAKKYYNMAYDVFTSHKFTEKYEFAISVCFNNLGLISMQENQFQQAITQFKKGFEWRQKLKLEEYYGHSFKYMAECFMAMQKMDSALHYFKLAVVFDLKKGPKTELVRSFIGLGKIYHKLQNNQLAKEQYFNAYNIAVANGLYPAIVEASNEFAHFYNNIGQLDSAIQYFKIALNNAKLYGQMDGRQLACQKLLEISEVIQDKDEQIFYSKELLSIEKQKQIEIVFKRQLEYEVDKRISEKALLQSANRNQQIIIFSVLLILFLLIFLLYYIYKNRNKYRFLSNNLEKKNLEIILQTKKLEEVNQSLNEYSNEIFHQKEEILTQSESLANALKELKELQNFKEGTAAMIVHDLKNPLNTILHQAKSVLVIESAKQMLNMIDNILDLQKYESTIMPANKKIIILDTIIENALFNTRYLTEQKNINIKNQTSRIYKVLADPELLERIYTNLLTNAIKYSPINGSIVIKAQPFETDKIKVSVTDNGPGINESEKIQVFEKFTQIITRNSGNTRSTGLGLAFCKKAVEALDGTIEVDTQIGVGTIFWFTLPLVEKMAIQSEKVSNEPKKLPFQLSGEILELLSPYFAQLKMLKVFEVSEIQQIIYKVKQLGINEIEPLIQALENAAYSVNQLEYDKLIKLI